MVARADQMSVLIVGMFAGRWHPCCPFTPLRLRHVPLAAFSKLPRLPVRAEGAAMSLVAGGRTPGKRHANSFRNAIFTRVLTAVHTLPELPQFRHPGQVGPHTPPHAACPTGASGVEEMLRYFRVFEEGRCTSVLRFG
jgi:hypothetical protein